MTLSGPLVVGLTGSVTVRPTYYVSWRTVVLRDPCPYCCLSAPPSGGPSRMSLEHVQPRSRDGLDGWSNIVGAHAACNQHRSDRSLLRFLLYRHLAASADKRTRRTIRRAIWSGKE